MLLNILIHHMLLWIPLFLQPAGDSVVLSLAEDPPVLLHLLLQTD